MTINYKKWLLPVLLIIGCSVLVYFFRLVIRQPAADPNLDRIAFISRFSVSGLVPYIGFFRPNIYVTNVNSPGLSHIIRASNLEWSLTWSPEGDKIAYYEYDKRTLYAVRADGSGQREALQQEIHAIWVDWSPNDINKIAYSTPMSQIHVLDLASEQERPLLPEPIQGADPSWSPDGEQIVFVLNLYDNQIDSSIAIIQSDGTDLVQLTPDDDSWLPEWSPAGDQIAFVRKGNIYVMNTDGTNVRALTQDGRSWSPTWSSDGMRIAFLSSAEINRECTNPVDDIPSACTNQLLIMNADGSNVVILRDETEWILALSWAPGH